MDAKGRRGKEQSDESDVSDMSDKSDGGEGKVKNFYFRAGIHEIFGLGKCHIYRGTMHEGERRTRRRRG